MSTYYYLVCDKCMYYCDFFTRQAWGWGNSDPILATKFSMYHSNNCGNKYLRVASEYEDEAIVVRYKSTDDQTILDDFKDYIPHTPDWKRSSHEDWVENVRKLHAKAIIEKKCAKIEFKARLKQERIKAKKRKEIEDAELYLYNQQIKTGKYTGGAQPNADKDP